MSRARCAVLGSPIQHSLSPVLHRAAYDNLELDWTYEVRDVTEAGLPAFLDSLDASWRGLSLTMPLKRTVVPLLDQLSQRAEQARAVNTVVLADGRRVGHNTDIPGVSAALRERWDGPVRTATVLGGGATAASAVLGLADLGCREVTLLVREESRAAATVAAVARHPAPPRLRIRQLGTRPAESDVLISTIPATAQGPDELALVEGTSVVFEVVYDVWPTPLAERARSAGKVLVAGLDLLVHQAVLQVQLMTGVPRAPLAAMRAAGETALAARRLT